MGYPSLATIVDRYDFVTMDIFDTALTRRWAHPSDLFLACADPLRASGLVTGMTDHAWMALRQECEASVFKRLDSEATTLLDIYNEMGRRLHWRDEQIDHAMRIELQIEEKSLLAVPSARALWQSLSELETGRRFLSDMYLPEAFVSTILRKQGYLVRRDDVWVSSTRGASKRNGTLYERARASLRNHVSPRFLHIGDNPRDDLKQARAHGIDAHLILDTQLPRVARRVIDSLPQVPRLASLVAGAMRIAFLSDTPAPSVQNCGAGGDQGIWQLGTHYAGPLLTLYVWWLLITAQERRLTRLYFLARDGQILLAIAKILQSGGVAPNLECRYLHASRQAWFAPAITDWKVDALARILDEPIALTEPRKLARRLGFISETDMNDIWPGVVAGLSRASTSRQIAELLIASVTPAAGLAHTSRLREQTLAYLEDQGIGTATDWAIVDLGWRGRLQECLSRILASRHAVQGGLTTTGFYIGLAEQPRAPDVQIDAITFIPGVVGAKPLPWPAHLIELLCEANHGSTEGYRCNADNVVQPVFKSSADPRLTAWGLARYHAAVSEYARCLTRALPLLGDARPSHAALFQMADAVNKALFISPDRAAAQALGSMPCTYSTDHDDHADLSPALKPLDAWLRALSAGHASATSQRTTWLPGSLARMPTSGPYDAYRGVKLTLDKIRRLRDTSLQRLRSR